MDYFAEVIGQALPALSEQRQRPRDFADYDGYRIEVSRIELSRRVIFAVTRL